MYCAAAAQSVLSGGEHKEPQEPQEPQEPRGVGNYEGAVFEGALAGAGLPRTEHLLVLNKVDVEASSACVSSESGDLLGAFRVSCATGVGVHELETALTERIRRMLESSARRAHSSRASGTAHT